MKSLYIGTNTKMYKTCAETWTYLADLSAELSGKDFSNPPLQLFVIPSYPALYKAKTLCPPGLRLGAQNMSWEERGALTGEVSPLMLQEAGVEIVELGHSERRHILGESDAQINAKVLCALRNNLTALLCVGETEEQKNHGISDEILRIQLKLSLCGVPSKGLSSLWIAYEPVWAIGESGSPASPEYAEQKHRVIRGTLCELFGTDAGSTVPILYGGSVNRENAPSLIRMSHVDGLFVGRGAWNAKDFSALIDLVLAQFSSYPS